MLEIPVFKECRVPKVCKDGKDSRGMWVIRALKETRATKGIRDGKVSALTAFKVLRVGKDGKGIKVGRVLLD